MTVVVYLFSGVVYVSRLPRVEMSALLLIPDNILFIIHNFITTCLSTYALRTEEN